VFALQSEVQTPPAVPQFPDLAPLPVLELKWGEGTVSYRWKADEPGFQMPIRVGTKDHWQVIQPTAEWQTMKTVLKKEEFEVATDLYFVAVSKL